MCIRDSSELPSTAVIDSAKYKINFKLTSESFTVYLQQMSQHYQNPPSVLWDDCADGNYYGSFDSNKNGYFTNIYYSWDDFCGDIQNNITNGWFGIGFYTSDEPQEYTTIIQPADTSLIIYYHDPNAYFDFTVKYDFGVGDFTINDSFGERIEQTPYTNAYQYGSQVKVTAHNQMGSDNYYRVFEKWERTIGNEETKTFYDSVSICEVTDSVLYKGRFIDEEDRIRNYDKETKKKIQGEDITISPLSEAEFSRLCNMFNALKPGLSVGFGFICNPTNRKAGYFSGERVSITDTYKISQGAEPKE